MPDDDSTIGPGAHETSALNYAGADTASAMVYAVLALASAVNRLADAQRDLVNIEARRDNLARRKV